MKRRQEGFAGWPGRLASSCDVAGVSESGRASATFASYLDARSSSTGFMEESRGMARDFAEFIEDPETSAGPLAEPDPIFQERLRRRLWRMHLLTHGVSGFERH
jgi:hypothetical protein